MKGIGRTVAPVGWLHGGDRRIVRVIKKRVQITLYKGTALCDGDKVGIRAREHRIPSVDGNPVNVAAPTPGHGGSTPPYIKVQVHPDQESGKPVVKVKEGRRH